MEAKRVQIKKEYLNPLEKQITYRIAEDFGNRVRIIAVGLFDDWSIIPCECVFKYMVEPAE